MAGIVHVLRLGLPFAVNEIVKAYDTPDMIRIIKERFWLYDGNDYRKVREIYIYPDASGDSRKSSNASATDDRQRQGLEYVEHTGAAIEAGKISLEDLENQMRQAGAKLLRAENTSTKSLDQTHEERMQENSPLYTMASSLEDALDNILQIMAEWLGEKEGGNVDVRTELDVSAQTFDAAAATAVQSLRQGGDIRQVDAVRVLQSLKFIDPDAKPEEVIDELRNQQVTLAGGLSNPGGANGNGE